LSFVGLIRLPAAASIGDTLRDLADPPPPARGPMEFVGRALGRRTAVPSDEEDLFNQGARALLIGNFTPGTEVAKIFKNIRPKLKKRPELSEQFTPIQSASERTDWYHSLYNYGSIFARPFDRCHGAKIGEVRPTTPKGGRNEHSGMLRSSSY
jgi:hypothetical protein